jgi:hypothetical protein
MKKESSSNIYVLIADHGEKSSWLADFRDADVAHEVAAQASARLQCDIIVSLRDTTPLGKRCCVVRPGGPVEKCAHPW